MAVVSSLGMVPRLALRVSGPWDQGDDSDAVGGADIGAWVMTLCSHPHEHG